MCNVRFTREDDHMHMETEPVVFRGTTHLTTMLLGWHTHVILLLFLTAWIMGLDQLTMTPVIT